MIEVFHLTLKTPISFITEVISLILILSTCLVANWSVSHRHRRGDGFLETQPFICLCGLFILVIKNGNTYEIIYGNHPTNTLTSLHLHVFVTGIHTTKIQDYRSTSALSMSDAGNFTLINLFDLFPLQIDLLHFATTFSSEIGSVVYLSRFLAKASRHTIFAII